MKSIFDKPTREELINRINSLKENSTAQWGKMNIYQMLKHCTLWEEWILSKKKGKQSLIGRLFGKMALKSILKNDEPLRRNTPTIPEFRIKEKSGDVTSEKAKWVTLLQQYEHFSSTDFVHPFFGKMTREQIGNLAYKHADHHLRQFNN